MPKTFEEREAKRCNRMGVPVEIDLVEASDVAPAYRKTRWGFAISELEGHGCWSPAPFGGGWPFTMGFRKHLFKPNCVCRRCGQKRGGPLA